MIGSVCGPIGRSMPSLISGLPARPMPTIRPSLMPMSAFMTPMTGSTMIGADHARVELARPGALVTAPSASGCSSRSPRAARRRGPGDPPRRGSTGPCRRAGSDRRPTGRSGPGSLAGRCGSRLRAPRWPPKRHEGHRPSSHRAPSARTSPPRGRGGSRGAPRDRTRAAGSPDRRGSARRRGSRAATCS